MIFRVTVAYMSQLLPIQYVTLLTFLYFFDRGPIYALRTIPTLLSLSKLVHCGVNRGLQPTYDNDAEEAGSIQQAPLLKSS